MKEAIMLTQCPMGQTVCVLEIHGDVHLRRRLRDMGLVEGAELTRVGSSPLGDPSAYLVRGAVLAIRRRDAAQITVMLKGGDAPWD